MRLRGSEDLKALQQRLLRLPEVAARVAQRSAVTLSAFAQASYDARMGVYDVPFGGGLDLHESGKLRALALRYTAIGTKIRASVGALPYAKFLIKYGILPRGGGKLPTKWNEAIVDIAKRELDLAMVLQ